MKALVLAGGHGTRLRPFSHSAPKQLVPVAGKPVLFHGLEALRRAGITEAGIVVNATGTAIQDAVGDGRRFGMSVSYLPQDEPRGLAHCVVIARKFLGDDNFVMYLGDNIFAGGIERLITGFRERPATAQIIVTPVSDPSHYGVATVAADGMVTTIEEKPSNPRSDLATTGLYCFTPEVHEAIGHIEPSWRNELEITHALQWLTAQGHSVRAERFSGYWADTGTIGDLLECNDVLLKEVTRSVEGIVDSDSRLNGPVVIEKGASIEGSTVTGPVVIGAGSSIVNSYVGPATSIGKGCSLRDAGVERSILMDRSVVLRVRVLRDSIIGTAGEVCESSHDSSGHRLLIGDDSRIEVSA